MTSEATYSADPEVLDSVAAVARALGEVIQMADGRAGVVQGLKAVAIGDPLAVRVSGVVTVAKTVDICFLDGGKVYWDRSANAAHFRPQSGDFLIGTAHGDAAAAALTMQVNLNVRQNNLIDFDGNPGEVLWTSEATEGVGVTPATLAAPTMLSFDAVAEVAQAALFPTLTEHHVPVADGPILEMEVAVYDIGDNAALDITFGLANGSHATDFDVVTEAVVFHLDGTALAILAESDDGTTEVAATDTTKLLVDDSFSEFWIDARDLTDIQLYVNGVNVLPASVFKLDAATGPIFPIVHIEKTNNDTVADVRVKRISLRTTDLP